MQYRAKTQQPKNNVKGATAPFSCCNAGVQHPGGFKLHSAKEASEKSNLNLPYLNFIIRKSLSAFSILVHYSCPSDRDYLKQLSLESKYRFA